MKKALIQTAATNTRRSFSSANRQGTFKEALSELQSKRKQESPQFLKQFDDITYKRLGIDPHKLHKLISPAALASSLEPRVLDSFVKEAKKTQTQKVLEKKAAPSPFTER